VKKAIVLAVKYASNIRGELGALPKEEINLRVI